MRDRRESREGTYIAAAHLGDERGGDDDGGAEHDEVVLEAEEDGLRCIANKGDGVSGEPWREIQEATRAGGGGEDGGKEGREEGRKRGRAYAMGAGW